MRTTSGNVIFPRVRQRYRPTWVISWSRHGYENASYCISHTGRQPAMQSPTAVPRIPASASGVSTQRSGPKRSRSPALARKTPPARPTSSPISSTVSSRSISTCSASLTASTSSFSAKPALAEVRRRVDEGMVEDESRIGRRLGLGGRDPRAHRLEGLLLHALGGLVVEDPEPAQVALEAADALVGARLLHPLGVDVDRRVVGGRVRRGAVADRLDERGAVAGARPLDRFARRLVDGEHVGAVHAE